MVRIAYLLTGHNIVQDFNFETQIFTNKKLAHQAFNDLIEYLIVNHSLDRDSLQEYCYVGGCETTLLDNKYNVTLREFEIRSKPIKYLS